METFEIYPAIDLLHGEVVRLRQGDLKRKTVYSRRPAEIADRWVRAGARCLHLVNLDGAFGRDIRRNRAALRAVFAAVGQDVHIQAGGGVRKFGDVEGLLISGASRVVIGTAAIENPALLERAVAAFGAETIAVGIDARDGIVRTHGWEEGSLLSPVDLGRQARELGIRTVIYTNIARDGMGAGVDRDGAQALRALGVDVIASGGAASLDDVIRTREEGLSGIIIGRALYEGQIDLAEAVQVARGML